MCTYASGWIPTFYSRGMLTCCQLVVLAMYVCLFVCVYVCVCGQQVLLKSDSFVFYCHHTMKLTMCDGVCVCVCAGYPRVIRAVPYSLRHLRVVYEKFHLLS